MYDEPVIKIKTNSIDQDKPQYYSSKEKQPDNVKRWAGRILMFLGAVGCILTSPLLGLSAFVFLSAFVVSLANFITKSKVYEIGLHAAKIGSLGFLSLLLYGAELTKATIEEKEALTPPSLPQKEPQEKIPVLLNETTHEKPIRIIKIKPVTLPIVPPLKPSAATVPAPVKKIHPGLFRRTQSVNFRKKEEVEAFIAHVNEVVRIKEAKIKSDEKEDSISISEQYIEVLVANMKNTIASEEFWGRLEQMTDKDISLFISKLTTTKEKRRSGLSELDYLWLHFRGVEFALSAQEQKKRTFSVMLGMLSEEQLKATFDSPEFLNIMNRDVYVDATANTLNKQQLVVFAASREHHNLLTKIIMKLKPDAYLLGKLVALMPYATSGIKPALINQLAHLAEDASFKVELTRLADHYININSASTTPGLRI